MNLGYWSNYVDQFNKIKHDVVKYLELQADDSWLQGKSITSLKEKQIRRFNEVEKAMIKWEEQLDYKTEQYIKVQDDGTIEKYIPTLT